mmetsp:Transcript_13759/g.35348  ORF Transcript_13759/g.35348 Transcript_13759/m.35348 type:complete len:110 (+) Transcript_13759:403-732(+)|eukprot:jgi/Tetstr1/428972/TSEL_018947.t1
MDTQTAATVDLYTMPAAKARKLSRNMFYGGFALLPWLWLTNVWLFWPEFRQGSDPEIQKYTRRSAAGFSVMTVALLAWMLTYYIGGPSLLGDLWYKLDVTGVPLAEYGL